jgi:hypothetical protein
MTTWPRSTSATWWVAIPRWPKDERLLRFVFPERPGALMKFLSLMRPGWNISLFHYRNQGADYGRILVGLQVPPTIQRHSQLSWTPWVIPTWKKPTILFTDCFSRRSM